MSRDYEDNESGRISSQMNLGDRRLSYGIGQTYTPQSESAGLRITAEGLRRFEQSALGKKWQEQRSKIEG